MEKIKKVRLRFSNENDLYLLREDLCHNPFENVIKRLHCFLTKMYIEFDNTKIEYVIIILRETKNNNDNNLYIIVLFELQPSKTLK
jgi:hypothetical protein